MPTQARDPASSTLLDSLALTFSSQRTVRLLPFVVLITVFIMVGITLSDSDATCPPKREKRFTPDEQGIRAKIASLSAFEKEMHQLSERVKSDDDEDKWNFIYSRAVAYVHVADEANRAACAAAEHISPGSPLAETCKGTYEIGDLLVSIVNCGRDGTKCIDVALGGMKMGAKHFKDKNADLLKELGGPVDGFEDLMTDPAAGKRIAAEFYHGTASVIETGANAGSAFKKGAEVTHAAKKRDDQETVIKGLEVAGSVAKTFGDKDRSYMFDIATAGAKAGKWVTDDLETASIRDENKKRFSQLAAQAEEKAKAASNEISSLSTLIDDFFSSEARKADQRMTPIADDDCDERRKEEVDRYAESELDDRSRVPQSSQFSGMNSDAMMREFQAYCGDAMNLSRAVLQDPNNNAAVNALQGASQRCMQFSNKYMGSLPLQYQNMIQQSLSAAQYRAVPSYQPPPTSRYVAPPRPSQGSISRSPNPQPKSSGIGNGCVSSPGHTCATK